MKKINKVKGIYKMTDYIEDIETQKELEFSTLYFSEDTNELIKKDWQSNNIFIIFRRMENSYMEIMKYLKFHKINGVNFIDSEIEEIKERILDCEHYLGNLVEFSKKPSAMFGQFVMGELSKNEKHIEMITVLDRKINNIPEIDNRINIDEDEEDEFVLSKKEFIDLILNNEPRHIDNNEEIVKNEYGDIYLSAESSIFYDYKEEKIEIGFTFNQKINSESIEIVENIKEKVYFEFNVTPHFYTDYCEEFDLNNIDSDNEEESKVYDILKDIAIKNTDTFTKEEMMKKIEEY